MWKNLLVKILIENTIHINEDTNVTFSDSSWNDCDKTGRSTGGNISIMQGGPVDHSSHLPIPVAVSNGKAEYISAACMRASHQLMWIYDLKYLGTLKHDRDNMDYEPVWIIINNNAAICVAKCTINTAGYIGM